MRRMMLGLLMGVSLLAAGSAQAAVITRSFAFQASGFTNLVGALPAPTDPVIGQVTVTFDTAVSVVDVTTGITLDSLNIALGSPISYQYGAVNGTMFIGGLDDGAGGTSTFRNDFWLMIRNANTTPSFATLQYVAGINGESWGTEAGFVTLVTPVPEPAALALLAMGVAGLGLVRRRRSPTSANNNMLLET